MTDAGDLESGAEAEVNRQTTDKDSGSSSSESDSDSDSESSNSDADAFSGADSFTDGDDDDEKSEVPRSEAGWERHEHEAEWNDRVADGVEFERKTLTGMLKQNKVGTHAI